jgi:hypothetical protein
VAEQQEAERRRYESRLRFSPTIEAGHLLQFIGIVGAAIVFGGGIYYGVLTRLADHDTKILLHDQRFVTNETLIGRIDETNRISTAETRLQLTKIIEQVTDLRLLVKGLERADPPARR